jgi:hypothetical protein
MARARNIKPGFFVNEELAELPFETRLLFIGLWTLADRDGRLEDRPKRIKMALFPADEVDTNGMLEQLHKAGFICRYVARGIKCIQVVNFEKHQTPHVREAASELPKIGETDAEHNLGSAEHNLGNGEASPRSPDSPFLIPDSPSLIVEEERVVRLGDGWVVTQSWEPSKEALDAARMAGVPASLIADETHLTNFRLKYSEAPQRDKAFNAKFTKWLINESRTRAPPKPLGYDPIAELHKLAEEEARAQG